MKKNEIILNWLPPAKIYFPSPSMTVLKGALKKYGYECTIVYWNILLEDLIRKYFLGIDIESLNDIDSLGIFFAAIALESNDKEALLKQIMLLKAIKPSYMEASFDFRTHITDCVAQLNLRIQEIFDKYKFAECHFCGFSMNLFQWVATSFIGRKLRDRHPNTVQVIGGIGNAELAEIFLKTFPCFDVSLWGEGEESIVQLAQSLDVNSAVCGNIISHGFVRNSSGEIERTRGAYRYWPLAECSSSDFDDFFSVYMGDMELVSIPVESSRGCHWNRCKFCFLNQGYCYRVKSVEDLCDEITYLIEKYGVANFSFMDNDVIGQDYAIFDKMLDGLQVIKNRVPDFGVKLAEIVSQGIKREQIKKMALAGFEHVQIGYESPSDRLLSKISKKNSFASNLLFCKWASIYRINIGGMNILEGLLDETQNDIEEGIKNVRFQRFFKAIDKYNHNQSCLAINKVSRYYEELTPEDKALVTYHDPIRHYLPDGYIDKDYDWSVFHFVRRFQNPVWKFFYSIDHYYAKNDFSYDLTGNGNSILYSEYLNNGLLKEIEFRKDSLEWAILSLCNEQVWKKEDIVRKLNTNQFEIEPVLMELNRKGILYIGTVTSECVTIINTSNIK